MKLNELLEKIDACKTTLGNYNHEVLSYMPEIANLLHSISDMSLDEIVLLQNNIEPIEVIDFDKIEAEWETRISREEREVAEETEWDGEFRFSIEGR